MARVVGHSLLFSLPRALQGMTFGYKDQSWQEEEGVRVIRPRSR